MSTTVDVRRTRVGTGWWLAPELAVLAILAVLAVPGFGAAHGQTGLKGEAARKAAELIERSTPEEHHAHGHAVAAGDRIFCGVAVFGTEPPDANRLSEVRIVYGYYFCASGAPGTPYLESNRADGPVVVRFEGTPAVQTAGSGVGYADRVRAMMPDQYEALCFRGLPDDSVAEEVRRRYEAA